MQRKRKLTKQQYDLLNFIYKYRFATTLLLAVSTNKKSAISIHPRLVTLEAEGYLGRQYDSSYRLQNKPAAYYLTSQGLRALAKENLRGLNEKAIKNSYKDRAASKGFIDRSLTLYEIAQKLETTYSNLRYVTKRELTDDAFSYFPQSLPDGFLTWKHGDTVKRFFLEFIDETVPAFVSERLLGTYIDYAEAGEWDITHTELPSLLFVAANGSIEKRLQKQVRKKGDVHDASDLLIYTTTLGAVRALNSHSDVIWTDPSEPEELLALTDL